MFRYSASPSGISRYYHAIPVQWRRNAPIRSPRETFIRPPCTAQIANRTRWKVRTHNACERCARYRIGLGECLSLLLPARIDEIYRSPGIKHSFRWIFLNTTRCNMKCTMYSARLPVGKRTNAWMRSALIQPQKHVIPNIKKKSL